MAVIDQYFKYLVEAGGSDLHLSEGQPPKIRVNGTISAISDENLEGQSFKNLLAEICDSQAFQKYLEEGDLDFAYEMDETSRSVSYTHLRAHETRHDLVCRLLLEKKKNSVRSFFFISRPLIYKSTIQRRRLVSIMSSCS